MSNSRSHDGDQEHSRSLISPPPLKRQRIGDTSSRSNDDRSRTPLEYTLPVRHTHSVPRRGSSSSTLLIHQRCSDSFNRAVGSRHSNSSLRASFRSDSKEPHSDAQSTKSHDSLGQLCCHTCRQNIKATSYNSAVCCTRCKRHYHDACRRPSLPFKADPQLWKCSKCLEKKRKSNPRLSTSFQEVDRHTIGPHYDRAKVSSLQKRGYMVTVNHTGAALGTPEDATMKTTIKPTISCLRTEIPNTPSPHTSQNHLSSSVPDSRKAITTSSHRERLKPSPYANGSSSAPPRSTIPESPDIHDQDKLRQSSCASVPRKSTDMAKYAEPLSTHQQHETELAQRANWEQSCHAFSKACPAEDKPALVENMVMSARTDNVLTVNKGGTLTSESVDTPKEASQARGEIPCTAEDDDDNQRAMSSIESQSLNRIPGLLPATVITLNQQPLLSSIVLGEQEEQSSPRLPKHSPATTRPVLPITATSPKMNMDKLRSDSPTTEMRRLQHHRKAKAYTMRELAQIALVAANGQRLTTAAVVSWLSATFSHLRTRDLEWQARVRSALSTFDEFSGEKISGTLGRGNKKSYAFSSSQTRTRYEREFPQFSNSAVASTGTSLRSLSVQSSVPTSLVPTGPNDEDFNSETSSTHSMQSKVASPLNKLRTNAIGQYSMPFQRVGNKDLLPPSHLVQNSRRVAKYCDIIMDDQQNAGIENMTEIEKWQRIAEIKARPSRKQNFGRNHKLAHKRRHRLQDVHDERDGAWTRPFTIKERTLFDVLASDIDMEIDGSQTLRDIFSLPVYAIPMNDGQSELAFRDGSMVNGRLPRPRNIYRVGKMFGGELTVRAS